MDTLFSLTSVGEQSKRYMLLFNMVAASFDGKMEPTMTVANCSCPNLSSSTPESLGTEQQPARLATAGFWLGDETEVTRYSKRGGKG